MSEITEGRKVTVHIGAIDHPCDGCDSGKKWTRRVSGDGTDTHLCVRCLRRIDALGGLEECRAACCVRCAHIFAFIAGEAMCTKCKMPRPEGWLPPQ